MSRRSSFIVSLERAALASVRIQREREAAERRRVREQMRNQREAIRLQQVQERSRVQQHRVSRQDEAQALTADVEAQIVSLRAILASRSRLTRYDVLASLRLQEAPPSLIIPSELGGSARLPELSDYQRHVQPLKWWEKIFGQSNRYTYQMQAAEQQFWADRAKWQQAEQQRLADVAEIQWQHAENLSNHQARIEGRLQEIQHLRESYDAGSPEAIVSFFEIVLECSEWPDDFPHEYQLAYEPSGKLLALEYELPALDVIPAVSEYRYVKTRDAIEEKSRKAAEIKDLYRDIVAATALRCISECFLADESRQIDVLAFNGFVHTIDRSTGNPSRPYLISVRVTRERFEKIVLDQVDTKACLRNLGASVSPQPAELLPVKPIVEFNMIDRRFIDDRNVVSELDSRPNLMDLTPSEFEALVGNLFTRMGLETKLTRTSRDGGVDAIAYDTRPILGGKVVIQAKRYSHTVGVSAVRDLYGTMMNEGANKGILVATSSYGPDAYDFCRDKPVELIDGSGLLYHLEQVGVKARIIFPADHATA